jgi:hypothetical protein
VKGGRGIGYLSTKQKEKKVEPGTITNGIGDGFKAGLD